MFANFVIRILVFFKFDAFYQRTCFLFSRCKEHRYKSKFGNNFNFVPQGGFDFDVIGEADSFEIGVHSHIKSATFIEGTGGVSIGDYFHTGRGLTVFSTSHNWRDGEKLPYDNKVINKPVTIGHYVWFGANVTVLPGTTVKNGVVVAAGSVIRGCIPERAVVAGNPAKIVGYRDEGQYLKLLEEKSFF